MGDQEAAAEEFYKVLELSPDYSWAYFNLAVIDYENGETQDALEKLAKTLELNPKDGEAYKIYAQIMAQQGMNEEARQVINMAFENGVQTGNLYYLLSQIDRNLENLEDVKADLEGALQYKNSLSVPEELIQTQLAELG